MPDAVQLFASILFGVIGFAAFTYGRKQARWQIMCNGIALMIYPYFVTQTWLLYGIGIALCAGLYFFRD